MNHPSHQEISRRAHKIWQDTLNSRGPDANWFEAERQLHAEAAKRNSSPPAAESGQARPPGESMSAQTAADLAGQRSKEARAPQNPAHVGPKPTPSESGKPLWSRPHSS